MENKSIARAGLAGLLMLLPLGCKDDSEKELENQYETIMQEDLGRKGDIAKGLMDRVFWTIEVYNHGVEVEVLDRCMLDISSNPIYFPVRILDASELADPFIKPNYIEAPFRGNRAVIASTRKDGPIMIYCDENTEDGEFKIKRYQTDGTFSNAEAFKLFGNN